ncbi:MAG: MFS transporter [Xanthomonadales bacterium]|jgi:predicted MFS family arabinose efflux permease|nr:MFS transporter [Xanthomonadales bacterium]
MSGFKEFKFGWPVVVSSALGIALGMSPLPFYTIGVFASPLMQEFGWQISQVMFALVVFTLVAMGASPLVGYLTDKLGVRRVVLTSITLFSFAFMAFALNNGSITLYLTLWGILALAGAGTLPITFTRAVSNWFNEKRGLALGVALIGTGISGAIVKVYAGWLIGEFGWRAAYVGVGALPLLIALPVAWALFRDTDDPKAAARLAQMKAHHADSGHDGTAYGLTLAQALRDWRFWLLAAVFVPLSFAIGGPIPNMETLLDTKGFDRADAIFLASLIGYAVFVGRLAGGYLLDHIWAPLLACVLLMMPAASMWLFMLPEPSYFQAVLAVVLLGVAAGIEYDLIAYLVSRYFGIRNYGAIYGILYAFFALGAGFGPAVYGRFLDQTGSYDQVLLYSLYAFIVCSAALLFLGPYRDEKLKSMTGTAPPESADTQKA